jgi:uncharacterized protein (DUF2147 family)
MKNILAGIFLSMASFLSFGQNNPDAILGKWMSVTGNCMVEVYKQDAEFKAKILWFKAVNKPMDEETDEKNHDPSLRPRKILGMDVMHGAHYDAKENEWVDGIIYDASSGKEWDSICWVTDDNFLKVKGYWLLKCLNQTKTFKKV